MNIDQVILVKLYHHFRCYQTQEKQKEAIRLSRENLVHYQVLGNKIWLMWSNQELGDGSLQGNSKFTQPIK